MVIALKIILSIFALASAVFGRLLFSEYKIFNRDIETKNTSLIERILVNGIIFVVGVILVLIFLFSIYMIFSNIQIETPF
jgi:hypothetical protein